MIRLLMVWCARRPPIVVGFLALVTALGLVSYLRLLPREAFPAVDSPQVVASGTYLVENEEVVDEEVVERVTQAALSGGAESIRSVAYRSSFSALVEMPDELRGEAATERLFESASRVGAPEFADVRFSVIQDSKYLDQFDLVVAVFTDDDSVDNTSRQNAASEVERALALEPEVELAQLFPTTFVGHDPVTRQRTVRQTSFTSIAFSDGSGQVLPSATIGVSADSGVDSIELRQVVDRVLDDSFPSSLPFLEGYSAEVVLDLSAEVEQQLASLQINALTGLVVVLLLGLPLLGWRASVATALFIAAVLATSLAVLWLIGVTLNTVSLLGIILALGLLVDDTIVMTDALQTVDDEDVADGAGKAFDLVGGATIAGTTTTALVFAPMLAITGVLGDFVRILPITVTTVLVVSLALSLFAVPTIVGLLGAGRSQKDTTVGRLVVVAASKLATVVVNRPLAGAFIGVSLTVVGLVVLAPRAGFNIFPPEPDSEEIELEIEFPSGLDLATAEARAADASRQTLDALGQYGEEVFVFSGNRDAVRAQVRLTPVGNRPTAQELIDDRLRAVAAGFEGGRVSFSQISAGPPELAYPFRVQIFNEDRVLRERAARVVQDAIDGITLSRGDGSTFSVVETEVAYTDSIARLNGFHFVEVQARFDATDVSTLVAATKAHVESEFDAERLAGLGLEPSALGFDFGTESDNEESFDSMNLAFALGLVLITVLLMALFRSSTVWLLVLVAVPFSFFGVFGGLLLTGHPISFFAMLGLMGLIGIVVNNSILVTDLALKHRRQGVDAKTAMQRSIEARFRPLLLTTATTVAAVLPLALRDPLWEALGLTIVFGLLSSTLLVLLALPAFFLGLERLRSSITPPWRTKTA